MWIAFQATRKARIRAQDGDAGLLRDLYFDGQLWRIRYVEVEVSSWLPGRRLLLMPDAVHSADWAEGELRLQLTRQALRDGPQVREHEPLSRQLENDLVRHFGWKPAWQPGPVGTPDPIGLPTLSTPRIAQDMNLWSMQDMLGFLVAARNGKVGFLDDFIIDDEHWTVRYLVVDIGNWITGRRVLVNPGWVGSVDFEGQRLHVAADTGDVDERPDFDPTTPINQVIEGRSRDYYGRLSPPGVRS